MFNDTLTRVRYPLVSDHGSQVPNLAGTPTTATVTGCDAQRWPPKELLDRREASEVEWQVFAPPDTDFLATDFAKINGDSRIYQVVGLPAVWGDGSRSVDHVIIYLRLSEVH